MPDKTIADLPLAAQINDADEIEGESAQVGSYKTTVGNLSRHISNNLNIPVATNNRVGGIMSSTADKQVSVAPNGIATVNGVPVMADLNDKVDKVPGKDLSEEDFTTVLKNKLDNIEDQAQVNVIEQIALNGVDIPPVNKRIDIVFGAGPAGDYPALTNKPHINNVELVGNKTSDDIEVVSLKDNQNIEGNKSFDNPVVVADPQAGNHAATKAYVDSQFEIITEAEIDAMFP